MTVQAKDQQMLWNLVQPISTPAALPMSTGHITIMKMTPQDDPETYVELFECATVRSSWPQS